MRIDTIQPAIGSNTPSKRLGRGIGSGLGKTSGKGHKGQWGAFGRRGSPRFRRRPDPDSQKAPQARLQQ